MPELEFLPEKTKRIEFGAKKKLNPGFLLLIFSVFLYGALLFYNQSLQAGIEDLDASFIGFSNSRNKAEEERINEVKSKLGQSRIFLEEHTLWSRGFKKIQQLTLASVPQTIEDVA